MHAYERSFDPSLSIIAYRKEEIDHVWYAGGVGEETIDDDVSDDVHDGATQRGSRCECRCRAKNKAQ